MPSETDFAFTSDSANEAFLPDKIQHFHNMTNCEERASRGYSNDC